MKILTYNVNGIRSAMSKGFIDFLETEQPDVVCLQEIKALASDIDHEPFEKLGYHCYWFPAIKKGYSGVGILSKIKPDTIQKGIGHDLFDNEGRVLTAEINGIKIMSCYFPSGTTGDIRQQVKYEFLDNFYTYIQQQGKQNLVVCGDYNICHRAIDIHDPVGNKNSSGFLPEERAWMDKWFDNGMLDSFRHFNPEPHHYTWWSFRAGSRSRNKGWRIDYISVSEDLRQQLKGAEILSQYVHSDHCGSTIIL
ncbi:MAG: exodeoxyribonuclease III [Bacteroidia bacterium]|nr:exodeoxyribonuclease III [Bacteroidia bacterium]